MSIFHNMSAYANNPVSPELFAGAWVGATASIYGNAGLTMAVAKIAAPVVGAFTANPVIATFKAGVVLFILGYAIRSGNGLPSWTDIAGSIAHFSIGSLAANGLANAYPLVAKYALTVVGHGAAAVAAAPYLATVLVIACVLHNDPNLTNLLFNGLKGELSTAGMDNLKPKLRKVAFVALPAFVLFAFSHPTIAGVSMIVAKYFMESSKGRGEAALQSLLD